MRSNDHSSNWRSTGLQKCHRRYKCQDQSPPEPKYQWLLWAIFAPTNARGHMHSYWPRGWTLSQWRSLSPTGWLSNTLSRTPNPKNRNGRDRGDHSRSYCLESKKSLEKFKRRSRTRDRARAVRTRTQLHHETHRARSRGLPYQIFVCMEVLPRPPQSRAEVLLYRPK